MKKEYVAGWKSWRNIKKEILKDELISHTGLEHQDAMFMLIPVEKLAKFETVAGMAGMNPFTAEICKKMKKAGVKDVVGVVSKEYVKMEGNDCILNGLAVEKDIDGFSVDSLDFVARIEADEPVRKKGVDFAVELPKGDDWMLYISA